VKKSPWPIALTGFFALLVAAMIFFVFWSLRQRVDLVAPDYYAQELRHQERINAIARAKREGLTPTIQYARELQQLTLQFPESGNWLSATGTVTLYRPSDASLDQVIPFAPDSAGAQVIPRALLPGLWRIKISWQQEAKSYFAEDALMVR